MSSIPDPARGPKWCDRARQNHDRCSQREQHESRWYNACSRQELDKYEVRLAQITPSEGKPITFAELRVTREGEHLDLLLLIPSVRVLSSVLRRLVELDRVERAR